MREKTIMMRKIPNGFYEKIDIIQVVSEKVELKKTGSQYRGLCPFHDDKNPSFYVSPMGVYYCFGCGEGGNALNFVMKAYGYDYEEAIEYLARKFNIELEEFEDENASLYKLLQYAMDFYANNLRKNEQVINYLKSRGLNDNSIHKFKIGYADSSLNIIKFLIDKGFKMEQIYKVGLAVKRFNSKIEPFFKNRIMFPIFSTNGKYVIGFSGRSIDESTPKYINSIDSPIFKKSLAIYGFNFARSDIVKKNFVIVVEGFFDTIVLHQLGYQNTVSFMGTNISDNQLKLISNYTNRIYLFFDSDSAGEKAIFRNLDKILNNRLIPYFVITNKGDPDEIALKGELDSYIQNPYNIQEYIKWIIEEKGSIEEKVSLVKKFKDIIANLSAEDVKIVIMKELEFLFKDYRFNIRNSNSEVLTDEVYALWNAYKSEKYRNIIEKFDEKVFKNSIAKKLFLLIKSGEITNENNLNLISKLEFTNREISENVIETFISKWEERSRVYTYKQEKKLESIIELKRR